MSVMALILELYLIWLASFRLYSSYYENADDFLGGCLLNRADVRTNPLSKDLSSNDLPSYTMAVASNRMKDSQTSVELNYYDDSLKDFFAINTPLQASLPSRITTIIDLRIGMTLIQSHTKDTNEINPSNIWQRSIMKVFKKWDDDFEDALIINFNVDASVGFYCVIYDRASENWTSQVDSQRQDSGKFIFGSLGLQVPNSVDFSRCKFEPFLKMYRGIGSYEELEKQGGKNYRSNEGVVLRTAAFGITQRKLEICARRKDVITDKGVVLKG